LFFSSDTVESSSQKLTSQGQEVLTRLDESGTKLIGYVPAGEGDSEVSSEPVERIIFEVTLSDDGSGSYTFTLLGALDHPDMGEDTFDLTFYFTARDADGDTTTGSFSVFLRDDVPDAIDDPSPAQSVYENTSRTNLVLAFDRSGSMGDDADGHGGLNHSRLALAKAAAIDLLNASNVGLVLIVTFSDDATVQNWMTKAQAIAFISGNTFPGPNGGTDYDDVTKAIINSYGTPTGPGAVYFFTDGKPSSEGNSINDSEQLAWDNFLAQKGIQSYAVAVGTGLGNIANDPDLLDLANPDGHIISLQVGNAGDDALLATAPAGASTPVTGNVLANDVFGADGAGANNGLKSVTIAGVEYTFTGSQITFGVNQVIPGSILTVPTSLGGTFTFYFANGSGHNAGDYAYGPPANVDTNQTEVFVYKIVDGDGDTDTASLSIQVLAKPTLSIGDVTVNEADGTATFTVTLTGKLAADLNFFATTTDGTAVDGTPENGAGTDDYTASNRTLTFPAAGGTTQTQTFTVPIGNDTVFEGNEQFFVRLTGVSPALVDLPRSDLQAVGTIVDNDVAPTLTISSPSATEGGGNSDDLKFVLGRVDKVPDPQPD
jgi:T1SS-143 domain-containing protein